MLRLLDRTTGPWAEAVQQQASLSFWRLLPVPNPWLALLSEPLLAGGS